MYVVTSDGAAGITDAVQQTRTIVTAAKAMTGEPIPARAPRYGFDFAGSTQGFALCPATRGAASGARH